MTNLNNIQIIKFEKIDEIQFKLNGNKNRARLYNIYFKLHDVTFYTTAHFYPDCTLWEIKDGNLFTLDELSTLKNTLNISEDELDCEVFNIKQKILNWADDNIKTVYINTYDPAGRFDMDDDTFVAFVDYMVTEAKKRGYEVDVVWRFEDDSFSNDFVSEMFDNYIPE